MLEFYRHPYPVIIEQGKDTWGIIVLGLPGCLGSTLSLDEAFGILNEMVDDHLEMLKEYGEPIPDPPPGPVFIKIVQEAYFTEYWDETLEYDQWLKVPEASKQLGLSGATVKTYIKEGRLPAYQPGRDYLLRQSDVTKFLLASRTRKSTGSASREKVA